jgi:uncharacterized membrane protein YeaQ/YmgE (transglycosylase-associated protein family)
VNIIAWIVFGALAGWVASMIMGTNRRQGCIFDIIIGVVGAFVGGLLYELLTGRTISFSFNLSSFIVAVIGAIILLAVVGFFRRR